MTIASELTKLQTNLSNAYTSCNNKGATMPSSQNFDNLATTINSIQTGGGGITPTGTIEITENGTYDVTNYASANVTVAGSGGGISFPAGTTILTLDDWSVIEEGQLKGAFQNITASSFILGNSWYAGGSYEVKSKGLQEAFKGNTKTTSIALYGVGSFATDALIDCFLNSSVKTITLSRNSGYTSTTGYDNKWGAPTATINAVTPEPV